MTKGRAEPQERSTQHRFEALSQRLRREGQEHLLQFWDHLPEESREHLAAQIESAAVEMVSQWFHKRSTFDAKESAKRALPCPAIRLGKEGHRDKEPAEDSPA